MSIYETDIWRLGIIKAPMAEVVTKGVDHVHWLDEEPAFQFLADPFGLCLDEKLYVFAESYNYRDRHGRIEVLVYNKSMQLLDRALVLEEAWHLSYPILIEDKGNIYMLPEAFKSGKTTLYKATLFPYQWQPVQEFSFPDIVIDPSVFFHNGLWWMFYTPADSGYSRQSVLSVAYSESLVGPWQLHPCNPVRITPSSSRPGGSVLVINGDIILPTQDCTKTYGGSLSFLRISKLTPDDFEAHVINQLFPQASIFQDYCQGVHTLSAMGEYTLIDAKKMAVSPIERLKIDIGYHAKKKLGLLRGL
ncbi:formyl transferase [Commensalibacter papalotli (ex Botero et al. 2024)]|uniref:Methionyl-tRNA formyltransferase (Fmt) (PDB:1FMT) n=1 Tax=Commensalibacter papalotli (ex Botero et al. 2024) TaxID=2972766 RepID=A0ABN8WEL8_9PROT|nr:formyl transferase [Commensalibacter papalotli (ex Botero et al. 2024)]CAI3945136.1 Methionyl-tRNA formyltransferase (Fmt) (PDB:1FMT) [Commensalibacter papalotli (ex Botero et al. 2024)]CAI3945729.1 Methionyl-tRNA formyltransferase (Fmt) (PDB:1FMT) [Commensalibacter papalotli (ex Botero et al. 2024)]